MSTVALPYDAADAAVANADAVDQNLYDATDDESFEYFNGKLVNDNRVSGWDIETQHVQRGAFSGGNSVGATGNLDYFEAFGQWAQAPAATPGGLHPGRPGASRTCYLPYATAFTLFTWQIFIGVSGAINPHTLLRFYVDGTQIAGQLLTVMGAGAVASRAGERYDRPWSGHHRVSGMPQGWHTVSVRIASSQTQNRVRVRSLDYVYFR